MANGLTSTSNGEIVSEGEIVRENGQTASPSPSTRTSTELELAMEVSKRVKET
jgi:hypothetical protein